MQREKNDVILEYDAALRKQQGTSLTLEKKKKQLAIQSSHGEDLRALVVEMLEQAE